VLDESMLDELDSDALVRLDELEIDCELPELTL
jgi:hypothetical protein